jgi:hypothetical protein
MSQEGDERSKRVECEDVGPTEPGGKIAGWTGAVLFFGAIAAYYVAAFLFAVWSWLALFGRVRTRAAEFGLVIWMAFIVAIFHFAGVLVKPWLICVVDRVVDWLRSLGRRNRMGRGQWVVEWDDEGVRCSGPEGEVESASWAALQAVWVLTTDRGPWIDDVFYVLEGTEGQCTVPSEAVGAAALIERLRRLPGFDDDAYTQAIRCTDNKRFLVWRRDAGTSGAGDRT